MKIKIVKNFTEYFQNFIHINKSINIKSIFNYPHVNHNKLGFNYTFNSEILCLYLKSATSLFKFPLTEHAVVHGIHCFPAVSTVALEPWIIKLPWIRNRNGCAIHNFDIIGRKHSNEIYWLQIILVASLNYR